ncbi:MAG: pyridoxal-dependent decarboxylase [Opitutus sp.]|nr:pyridoxal-dependent decarboxylase [Opitutus sp.]
MSFPAPFQSPLEPTAAATREAELTALVAQLVATDHQVQRGAVSTTLSAEEIRARIAALDLERGAELGSVLPELLALLAAGQVHTPHPRNFGLFIPTPTFAGQAADLITAMMNPQLAIWSLSPAPIELEQRALRFVGECIGGGADWQGQFTSGGAEANATGLLLALTRKFPDYGNRGTRALTGDPVFYTSAECHLAWLKIAHLTGIGRAALRLVPVDESLRMDVAALRAMIADDKRTGCRPFLIAATAGTTAAGAIDPLEELAAVAREENLHLHVDAAWAGALVLSRAHRAWLRGLELADSITIDAHKWLSLPMGAGMVFARDRAAVEEAFRVSTSYMPTTLDGTVNPYVLSMQWSRRFIGLKLLLTLANVGRVGYERQFAHDIALGTFLRARLRADGWEILNDTPLPVVCFAATERADEFAFHQCIADAIVGSGVAWISTVKLRGQIPGLRACITSYRCQAGDVEALIAALAAARAIAVRN